MGQVQIPAPPASYYQQEPPQPMMMNPPLQQGAYGGSTMGSMSPYYGGLGSLSNMLGTMLSSPNAGNNLSNIPGGVPGPAMPRQTRSLYPGMGAGSGGVRTMEFIDVNRNGIDDRDETPKFDLPAAGSGMLDQPPASDYTYVPSITRADSRMDPITQQLLFGLDGEGGFIPGAMRAARSTFFDEQGRARVIPKEIAGFSPDEVRAFELAREVPTVMDPYIQRAEEAYKSGLGEFDPSTGIQPYMDPFEDAVVKQTMSDIMEAGAQRDISARAGDIARGGESAFGSRARLGAAERERALGRGLGEAIGALRSRGFEGARSAAMGEFARNQMGERGFGGFLSGLGTQKQGGLLSGISALTGTGGLQRGMSQADLDARREAAMQGQAAPLSMYQALSPFINMAPRGTTSFNTQFGVPPNPLQQGIGTGLATLGALGQLYGGLSGAQQRTV